MGYVKRGLCGLGRARYVDAEGGGGGGVLISTPREETISPNYSRGYVAPTTIIGRMIEAIKPSEPPGDIDYGRGAIAPIIIEKTLDTFGPLVHPPAPGAPSYGIDDAVIVPTPPPPIIRTDTRLPIISKPVIQADSKIAFELAEAKRYGYTHTGWMSLGPGGRAKVREQYPGGYNPVTRDGTSSTAARVDVISGRDPVRSLNTYAGAGDYPGGMEIANPKPSVPLKTTTGGVTFDNLLQAGTAETKGLVEAGSIPAQDYVRFAIMGFGAWFFWNTFLKPQRGFAKKKGRLKRRKYPYASHAHKMRQGYQ